MRQDEEPRRRGRAHDPQGRRRAVLDAARRLFADHGYTGVGIRAIAAEADVTPGLVMAYFGTKDALFREVVGSGAGVGPEVLRAAGEDPARLPDVLARAYLDRWDRLQPGDPWPALIRSAVTHAPSAELLRSILERQVGEPLAALLGDGPDAEVRTAVVRSILFGVIMERYVFAHEPAASVPSAELGTALSAALATALGPAPSADTDSGTDTAGGTDTVGVPTARATPPAPTEAPRTAPADRREPAHSPDLFAALGECTLRYQALLGRMVKEYGISLPALDVLTALHTADGSRGLTMGEVSATGAVRAGGLTQHADRLEARGLIRRERDPRDRRIVRLRLTDAGSELTDRVAAARRAREDELLSGLAPADRRRLSALLGTLSRTLEAGGPEL
ncbi:TetR/AcrR family transcriptional regulator [Streptomyces triticagri]|uniref:TetR/AcrR family transcriptional regulator n=1 Tax=Streptomyces triticagri TaxID=2293568 RepID=UPI000FFC8DC2|nr:TetR family transcriptional regulator [Streptomyces triticagri]